MSLDVLILGPQGSGKGTQAKRIAADYGVAHIATGEMFREAMTGGTPLGLEIRPIYDAGELIPDELTIGLFKERLGEDDTRNGFVLDGFPRNSVQADALDELLEEIGRPLDAVLVLEVADEICIERMLKRAAEEGRPDDTRETIARRLAIYHAETAPLVEHYLPTGKVVGIHGEGSVDLVWSEIQDALEALQGRA